MFKASHIRVLGCMGFLCSVLVAAATAAAQTTGPQQLPLVPQSMRGADLFRLYCATCHGRDGQGHGPVAPALKTHPADLTTIAMRNLGMFPRARVELLIVGGNPLDAHGSEDMPVWGPIFKGLDPSDARVKVRISNLVSYLESIQKK